MIDLLAAVFVLLGCLLMLIAAVGVIRMPDVYVRLQASTKAASLGAGALLLALALHFADLAVTVRAGLAIVFIFLTVPVSAHMIGRAAYLVGVPLWKETRWDELRGRYDPRTHQPVSPATGSDGMMQSEEEEAEMIRLLGEGRTDDEIAEILGLSSRSVAFRFEGMLARRGVDAREELTETESTGRRD